MGAGKADVDALADPPEEEEEERKKRLGSRPDASRVAPFELLTSRDPKGCDAHGTVFVAGEQRAPPAALGDPSAAAQLG